MKILAIECSSSQRSVALVENPRPANGPTAVFQLDAAGELAAGAPGGMLLARAAEVEGRRVIGLIEQVLEHANCQREQIDVIAVGLGPGSYTGVRGAIALAQGWQIGLGTKLLGISSVECLAAQGREAKMAGLVNIIIDAQRSEFYLARYEIDDGAAREIEPLRLAGFSQIENLSREGMRLIGPDIARWFPNATNVFPDAAALGVLASDRRDFVSGDKLEPVYLRETAFKKAPPPLIIG